MRDSRPMLAKVVEAVGTLIVVTACTGRPSARRAPDAAPVVYRSRASTRNVETVVVEREGSLRLATTASPAQAPTIGRITPGVRLTAVRRDDRWTEVELPAFGLHALVETAILSPPGSRAPVPDKSLATVPAATANARSETAMLTRRQVALSATAEIEEPFFTTRCDVPIRIVERTRNGSRIAQAAGGIEIIGWSHEMIGTWFAADRCSPRVIERDEKGTAPAELPAAYGRVSPIRDPLGRKIAAHSSIYWLSHDADSGEVSCDRWTFARGESGLDASLVNDVRIQRSTGIERLHTVFGVTYAKANGVRSSEISLLGPASQTRELATGRLISDVAISCGSEYTVVDGDEERLSVVRGTYPNGLVGYHLDDVELWFMTRAACESAIAHAGPNLVLQLAQHAHAGC